jgi:hypothetical protein
MKSANLPASTLRRPCSRNILDREQRNEVSVRKAAGRIEDMLERHADLKVKARAVGRQVTLSGNVAPARKHKLGSAPYGLPPASVT